MVVRGRRYARRIAVAALALVCGALALDDVRAQSIINYPPPASTGVVHQSSAASLFDLGTHFLDRLGLWSNYGGAIGPANINPQGGGAPASNDPRYRTWFETYGTWSRTDAQGTFLGDKRWVYGAIAGIGATVAPGASVGFSVDRGRTNIDIPGAVQSATINLTQLGLNGSYQLGSWVIGAAVIYGIGDVDSERLNIGGYSTASYGANLWGAVAELNYVWAIGNSRIVPKIGADWMQTRVDAFTEVGGALPISALSQSSHRGRVFAGAEFGHSWIAGTTIYDISAYGKVVNIVAQEIDALQVSSGASPVLSIQGIEEARTGFETGAALSAFVTQTLRVYVLYDGKFREGFHSNSGTIGVEVKW